jgi:hypothetical protein
VSLRRHFGKPSRLDVFEHVWLICGNIAGSSRITLNGHALAFAATGHQEFNVTTHLARRNELVLDFSALDPRDGLADDITLEIRRSAYLADCHARQGADQAVSLMGRVAGTTDRPLELYLRVDGEHHHYQRVEVNQAFDIPLPLQAREVRAELVAVSEVWFVIERTI